MILLLLDSSNANLTIALSKEQQIIYEVEYEAWQRQSELLTFEIEKALRITKLSAKHIDGIVVSVGPGSYTGVRIAVTVAKTFSYALQIPLYQISSLAVMRVPDRITIAVVDARSGRSYVGVYLNEEVLLHDTILHNEEVLQLEEKYENAVFTGELKHLGKQSAPFNRALNLQRAINKRNEVQNPKALKPVYLKEQYGQR